MPHSSGGGHHGGSFHGSSGSRMHSGGSGFSSDSSHTSYYYVNGRRYSREVVEYSDTYLVKTVFSAVMMLVLIVILLCFILPYVNPENKLKHTESNQPHILDPQGILGDTEELEITMKQFKDKTGIAVVLVAIPEHLDNPELQNTAYSLYMRECPDETFWLLAYSAVPNPHMGGNLWSFEGMQGDKTDAILTPKLTYSFNFTLTYQLDEPSQTPAQAFQISLSSLIPMLSHSKELPPESETIFLSLIVLCVRFFVLLFRISRIIGPSLRERFGSADYKSTDGTPPDAKKEKKRDASLPSDVHNITCPECGSRFPQEGNAPCPFCGYTKEIE